MKNFIYLLILLLNACVFGIYEDKKGNKTLKPKYAPGVPFIYQDGTYSTNHRYNANRPQIIPVDQKNLNKNYE